MMLRLALLLAVLPQLAAAQGTVRGVVLDSLRRMGPAAGVEVVLMPGGQRRTTDARGRFAFDDVTEGRYTLVHSSLWLDSIGVPALAAPVDVGSGGRVETTLVLGSRAALALRLCGGAMDADRGLVVGEVRDARGLPAAGAIIAARWSELVVGGAGPTAPVEYVAADTTGPDGRFGLCGMRERSEVLVFGRHPDGRRTGTLVLTVDPAVYAHDLVLGDAAQGVRVRGRVVNTGGAPVPRADVLGSLATAGAVRSDSLGRFELATEAGSRQLVVRALGFAAALVDVRASAPQTDLGDIVLQPAPTLLDTMVIRARAMTREEAEFEYRRRTATGGFLTEEQLRRLPAITPNTVAALSPGWVRGSASIAGSWGDIYFTRGIELCKPRLFVNGFDWGERTSADEIRGLLQMAKRIEMYRAAFAPAEFADFNGCGALVVWLT